MRRLHPWGAEFARVLDLLMGPHGLISRHSVAVKSASMAGRLKAGATKNEATDLKRYSAKCHRPSAERAARILEACRRAGLRFCNYLSGLIAAGHWDEAVGLYWCWSTRVSKKEP